jgi:polar amino acid transport system permease protein
VVWSIFLGFEVKAQSRKWRVHWLDFVVLGAVLLVVGFVAFRVGSVLKYHWDWTHIPNYILRFDEDDQRWVANLLLHGFLTTVRLALWGSLLAAAIGVFFGLCRISQNLFLRMLGRSYVELIRNVPPLVFLFVFYFFISSQMMPILGIDEWVREASPETLAVVSVLFGRPGLLSNFISGLIALAMFEAAYVTEIVRAGIQAIDKGQWEGAQSLGLSRLHVMRDVILPQAIKRVVPPLANQFISLIKDSSIVALVSIQELTFMALEVVVATSRVFEVWITVALMYFVICFGFSMGFDRLEKRLGLADSRERERGP